MIKFAIQNKSKTNYFQNHHNDADGTDNNTTEKKAIETISSNFTDQCFNAFSSVFCLRLSIVYSLNHESHSHNQII